MISEEHVLRFCKINKVIDAGIDTETSKVDNRYISISKTDFPDVVILEKCRGIKIFKNGLSSKGLLLLRKLASYANPEFYSKQAMRQSTYGVPRVTVVYDEDDESIILPRGIESELLNLFGKNNIKYLINDNRYKGYDVPIEKGKEVAIENGKVAIEYEKIAIEKRKVAIEEIYLKCVNAGLSNIMINRITTFYELVGDNLIFGRKDIAEYLNFSYSNAGKIIVSMKKANIIVEVDGKGKGKYQFTV